MSHSFVDNRALADLLIDLELFRIPAFRASLVIYARSDPGDVRRILFLPQYLQLVLGFHRSRADCGRCPWSAAFVVGSHNAARWRGDSVRRYSLRCGLALSSVGYVLLMQIGTHANFALFARSDVHLPFSASPVFTLTNDVILASAPPERAGAASGISETCAEFGGALSIAAFGSIGAAIYRAGLSDAMPGESLTGRSEDGDGHALAARSRRRKNCLPELGNALVDGASVEAFLRG